MKNLINYRFIKYLLLLLSTIALSFFIWVWAIHEPSHAVACKALGGNPELVEKIPILQVNCIPSLGKIKDFAVLSIPYILGFAVLLLIQFVKIEKYLIAAISTAVFIDSGFNLFTAVPYRANDFVQLGILGRTYLYITIIIIFLNCMLYIRVFVKNNLCRYLYLDK